MEQTGDREMETLQELLALMKEHDLDRLKVKRGDAVYELVRRDGTVTYAPAAPPPAAPVVSSDPAVPVAGAHVKKVVAPLTGVFYRSPSPDTDSYVEIGSHVSSFTEPDTFLRMRRTSVARSSAVLMSASIFPAL